MLVLPQGLQGRMEQTASYDAYTYLSKRLTAELPGNSQPALPIPFLSPGSLELPSSTGKSLDFVDATFSQHPLVTMTLGTANETHLLNAACFSISLYRLIQNTKNLVYIEPGAFTNLPRLKYL